MNIWFIPSRKDVDEATASLIGLSNEIPPRNDEDTDNYRHVNSIRKKLRIKFYE